MLKVYWYKGCSSCVKAKRFLEEKKIGFELIPIREQPPSVDELKQMVSLHGIRKILNSSGQDYRELNLKDKLPGMSEDEIFFLLHSNGNLVKRPFVVGDKWLVGFKEWDEVF
jgi:arsenate reductase (glutaredoxin)